MNSSREHAASLTTKELEPNPLVVSNAWVKGDEKVRGERVTWIGERVIWWALSWPMWLEMKRERGRRMGEG